jgi:hypothetical protein
MDLGSIEVMYALVAWPASRSGNSAGLDRRDLRAYTWAHMAAAAAFLIVLIEVAVIAAVLYLVIRFGVRDGMSDFENRKARRGPWSEPLGRTHSDSVFAWLTMDALGAFLMYVLEKWPGSPSSA